MAEKYVYTTADGVLYQLDPSDMSEVATFSTENLLRLIAHGRDGYVYVCSDTVINKVDPASMEKKDAFSGFNSIDDMEFDNNGYLYVADFETIYKIDPASMAEESHIVTSDGIEAISSDGSNLYVAHNADYLIDKRKLSDMSLIATNSDLSLRPLNLEVGVDGFVYVVTKKVTLF